MSDKPHTFMPLVLGDFLKHTARLSDAEIGSYLLILIDYWVNGAPPDVDEELARVARCTLAEWRRRRVKLARFFTIEGGVWTQKRVEEEYAGAVKRKERARVAVAAREAKRKAAREAETASPRSSPRSSSRSTQDRRKIGSEIDLVAIPPSPSPPEEDDGPTDNIITLPGAIADSLPADDPRRAQGEAAEASMTDEEKAEMQAKLRELAITFRAKRIPGD